MRKRSFTVYGTFGAMQKYGGCKMVACMVVAGWLVDCADHRTVDLRPLQEPVDVEPACSEGQRKNPDTKECEACFRQKVPPTEACLCAAEPKPGPFPLCDDPWADYDCLPCDGNFTQCSSYDPETHRVDDCSRFEMCCDALAASEHGTPCCGVGTQMVCTAGPFEGQYVFECVACCVGATCEHNDECAVWQVCDAGQCTPPCEFPHEFCDADCICKPTGSAQ